MTTKTQTHLFNPTSLVISFIELYSIMTLSQKKYSLMLTLQYICLLFDVCSNSFYTFLRKNPADLLILFVIQDFCLILSLTILLATFFSTYMFQAGLIQFLYKQFRMTLVICVIYIILSITLHSWYLTYHWTAPMEYHWTNTYESLYITHRTTAVIYYYFSKRASLRISDPKFHEGSEWMKKQFTIP